MRRFARTAAPLAAVVHGRVPLAQGHPLDPLSRAEHWPMMPVLWHSFELRPFDFFDRNLPLDLLE